MTFAALCRRISRSLWPMLVQKGRSSSMTTIVHSFLFHYFTTAYLYVDCCIYAEESIARVKFAYSQGHQIGSHTWAHKNLSTLASEQVNSRMARTEQTIQHLIGVQVAFTRLPYGEYNDNVRQVAANRNKKLVNWSFDSGDLIGATPAEGNAAYDKLVKDHPSLVLALNHEVYSVFLFFSFKIPWIESYTLSIDITAFIVAPHAIKVLQSAGYKLVTITECLGQQPYLSTGPPTAVSCSSLFICNNTPIDISCIRFVGHWSC